MRTAEGFHIGADIGTTGCRVSIYDVDGRRHATASAEYPLHLPQSGWVEQNPEDIVRALRETLRTALDAFSGERSQIRTLTFSTVLHSIFPVDAEGRVLHPMLIFADSRAQGCLAEIRTRLNVDQLYLRTGCPLHPMYPLPKILWFRRERPEIFRAAARFISIKELLIHRFTGTFLVDRSIASGTGLFNFQTDDWDAEALTVVGIRRDQLSPVRSTTFAIDDWNAEGFGLPRGTRLVLGAGDGVLSTFGAGAIGPGQYTAMIGTSGAVRVCAARPRLDPVTRNWCYNLTDDLWVAGGAISNGGLALRWARDKFAATETYVAKKLNLDPYEVLARYAEQKPAGSEGLIFLPFLAGERSPYWNANARGVLFGLTLNHGPRHLMRATLEGVLYSMYSVFRALRALDPDVDEAKVEIRASGSFSRSRAWLQMMADVFGHPIVLPGEPEGSVFGAAALGMLAAGALASPAEVRKLVGAPRQIFSPDLRLHGIYRRLFGIYERVYRNLLAEFDEIAELQNEVLKAEESDL